ncbi:pentapeptide repeat-containing protein [Anaeromicropila herbilytica]|uniref:Pentapeptide repeat-containing protein n=1 Tax=Anaeromicropila herbilytica TaxID=2785025 RepID=A0A7R7EP20_9FIRM|nr:pentapeptide repeat-containing protein [Anaeromicropila herbilytica]BCN32012.1 hypothetical protein bsdtb5_33070 [Anaeromicropila herbilytica]
MYQYYIGKEEKTFEEIYKSIDNNNLIFSNDSFEPQNANATLNFNRCTFSMVSFHNIEFDISNFSFCVFIGCYFKSSKFSRINFKNCTFIDCGFYDTMFENFEFFYSEWNNSYIKFENIKNSIPSEYNYRKKFCKTMAINCIKAGNMDEYKKYFFESMRAKELNYKAIILREEKYYKDNYSNFDSIRYSVKFMFSKISGLVWGYGERISNVIYSIIVVLLIYAGIYYCTNDITNVKNINLESSIYLSIASFFNINIGYNFNSINLKVISITEYVFGLVFIGMVVTYLFRYIDSREK